MKESQSHRCQRHFLLSQVNAQFPTEARSDDDTRSVGFGRAFFARLQTAAERVLLVPSLFRRERSLQKSLQPLTVQEFALANTDEKSDACLLIAISKLTFEEIPRSSMFHSLDG